MTVPNLSARGLLKDFKTDLDHAESTQITRQNIDSDQVLVEI